MSVPYVAQQTVNDFGQIAPKVIWTAVMGAGESDDFAVPVSHSRWKAVFSYSRGKDVWVSVNGTAAAAVGNTFAAAASELNPSCREVKSGDTLDLYAISAATSISVAFYPIDPIT